MFATGNQSCWHGQFAHARVTGAPSLGISFFCFHNLHLCPSQGKNKNKKTRGAFSVENAPFCIDLEDEK
ncbi:hypothetical protein HMPREF9999_01498 [Alloprevotella sp. oral taxon 473 str. F0040]|nr:hypothetical protein HMPREF9999_01498 [Alloprevotella sp. oral taxon 473 str. F0040]